MSNPIDALLPCPFCGGEAKEGCVCDEASENFGGHYIECSNPMCGASTNLRFGDKEDPRPYLREQWNRRAALPSRAEIERQARERALKAVDECFGRELLTLSILAQGFGESSHIAYAKERMEALRKVIALIPQEPQS